nr:hypothetical protein [uncultured Sphaerochaeta sp.]
MKNKHILTSIALTLLLSLMLLSCNADATAGLFRQISESKAPVGIVYKQIVGLDSTGSKTLYYLTDEGLYSTNGTSSTKLVANAEDNIINTAALDGTTTIAYQVNTNEDAGYKKIKTVDNSGVAGTTYDFSAFENVKLLPNGLVLTKSSADAFALYDYDAPVSVVVSIATSLSGYSVDAVLQPSGTKHQDLSTTPILVSLTNLNGDYKHYYVSGATATALPTASEDKRYASMTVSNGNIYLLTYEGEVYGATSVSGPFTLMHDTNESYEKHAFMYATSDGTNTRLITKPDGINEPLYVISFPDDTVSNTDVTSTTIREGYGVYLDAAEIVDSYEKSVNNLLVATLNNGMYEIEIAADTSSETEEYTL